jgi:hypothetical protein
MYIPIQFEEHRSLADRLGVATGLQSHQDSQARAISQLVMQCSGVARRE